MAKKDKQQPFNLLYRFEPQKTSVDKVYDFVVFQGRIIVMGVMLVIILAFAYRFPLDKKLNDEVNLSNDNLKRLDYYANESKQRGFNDTTTRIASAKNFINIYNRSSDTDKVNQIKLGEFLKLIRNINTELFKEDIIISDYSYTAEPKNGSTLTINGETTTFPKGEDFREKIVEQVDYVEQTTMQMAASQTGTIEFTLQIQLKK